MLKHLMPEAFPYALYEILLILHLAVSQVGLFRHGLKRLL